MTNLKIIYRLFFIYTFAVYDFQLYTNNGNKFQILDLHHEHSQTICHHYSSMK